MYLIKLKSKLKEQFIQIKIPSKLMVIRNYAFFNIESNIWRTVLKCISILCLETSYLKSKKVKYKFLTKHFQSFRKELEECVFWHFIAQYYFLRGLTQCKFYFLLN